MATCRVKRNDNGNITKVNDANGAESVLFNTIAKHPMVTDSEEALDIFKNSLSDKVGESPSFRHRVDGVIVDSYKEALKRSNEGDLIEIGFQDDTKFYPIISINKTTDRSTQEGFVNNLIENNILSENKKKTKDGYKFQAAGNSEYAKVVNTELIRDSAGAYLGVKGIGKDASTFNLKKTNDKTKVIDHDGNLQEYTREEIDGMSYEQLQKITPYAIDFILSREVARNRPAYGFNQPEVKVPGRSEEELKLLLLNFMDKLGISTMSISQYIEKYNVKNGVDPSVNALADISNKIIAFHEGRMGLEALTEEVAHFINEAMPQQEVNSILQNIHKSNEWNEHAGSYREIYSKRYEGEELENAVRREVLGKVLANSILSKFNVEGVSNTQSGFINKAFEIVTKFFEKIEAYFRPEYRTQLDSYLNSVEEILRADEISDSLNTDNFEGNNLVLFNMNKAPKSSIALSAEKSIISLRDQIQSSLAKAKKGSSINKQKLQNIQRKLEEKEEISAVADINSLTNTYITMLDKAVEDAKKTGKPYIFTQEENVIYQALKSQLIPSLNEIQNLILDKTENKKEWSDLKEELDSTVKIAGELQGKVSNQESGAIQNLIDRVMIRHELPESSRNYIEKWVNQAESDTNWFHTNFGMLTHAKDGLLNLAGMLQKDITTQSNIKWQDSTKQYQQRLRSLGVTESEIKQFMDGQFIVSEYDFNKFEAVLQRMEANLYKDITKSKLSVEELIEAKQSGELEPLDSSQEVELRRKLKDLRNPLLERKFNSSYYDEFENKLSKLDISQEGIKFIMNYYGDMSQFKRAAERQVGDKVIMDFSQLSEQDKALRNSLIKERNNAKSYFEEGGVLKKGLEFDSEGEVVPSKNIELSRDAQIAIDLNKLDSDRNTDLDTDDAGIPKIFTDTLREIDENEGRGSALEFLFMNSFIGFTDEYWDSVELGGGRGIVAKLEKFVEENDNSTAIRTLKTIKEDKNRLKSILKVYRNKNNPSEVDVSQMPLSTRHTVKTIQQRLTDNYRLAGDLVKDIQIEGEDVESSTLSTINDSYYKRLEDLDLVIDFETDSNQKIRSKIKEEVEFATQHMTDENKNVVNNAMESINFYRQGKNNYVLPIVEKKVNELGYELIDLLEEDTSVEVLQALTRSRLLPYYTRFAPAQYGEFMKEINTGTDNLADILPTLENKFNYMEINPNYSFFDEDQNQNLNPNYVENFEGGYLQPKKNLSSSDIDKVVDKIDNNKEKKAIRDLLQEGGLGFKSNKYKELFGSNPSGNLFEAYKATLEYNKTSLEAMGTGSSYNIFTAPQVKQNRMDRFSQFTANPSLEKIKEAFGEEFTYTEDDKVQGETNKFGDSVKIIPKMYVDRIENPNDLSNELFYSLTLRAQEAYLREARVEHYGDFMAIYDKVVSREYKGKDSKSSNTLEMFESAMDYSLFGVKETAMYPVETMFGTIDIAKLARKLLSFIKFRNLAYNIVIPITSYITGRTTREIEKYVGEHMDKRSQVLGDKEFRKHSRAAIGEVGEINTKSKLNVMGQYFQAFDMAESFQNSNYGKHLRLFLKTGMMLHTGANFPLYASTLLGVLHDFRVVNGSIMRFNQFQRQKLAEGLSKKEVKNEWDTLESEAIYNFMDVKDGEMVFSDDAIRSKVLNKEGNKMSEEEYETFKSEKMQTIRGHVSNVITNIDGQIPNEARVHAQRHFALNYFMTHRGWLSIVASRRFKNRHLNVETGELEEGSYRTLWNFIGRYIKQFKKGNFSSFVKNWKDVYDNADPDEAELIRSNMKRIGIEMAALNGLMLIGLILNGMADDDEYEDSYGIQGTSYLFNRTLNELSSAQLGSINNFSEVIESPFVGWNTVKTMTDVGDLFNSDPIKYGTYAGLSERQRFITKLVPGAKQIYDLSSAERVKKMRDTYMFYNNANFNYSPIGNLYWLSDENK